MVPASIGPAVCYLWPGEDACKLQLYTCCQGQISNAKSSTHRDCAAGSKACSCWGELGVEVVPNEPLICFGWAADVAYMLDSVCTMQLLVCSLQQCSALDVCRPEDPVWQMSSLACEKLQRRVS